MTNEAINVNIIQYHVQYKVDAYKNNYLVNIKLQLEVTLAGERVLNRSVGNFKLYSDSESRSTLWEVESLRGTELESIATAV